MRTLILTLVAIAGISFAAQTDAQSAGAVMRSGNAGHVMLNPQPLPPKDGGFSQKRIVTGNASKVMLNPQPLPPKAQFRR